MKRRATRRLLMLVLLLVVAGAIVNVAVAWGCAAWMPFSITGQTSGESLSTTDQIWLEASGWRRPRELESDGLGVIARVEGPGLQANHLAFIYQGDFQTTVSRFDNFAIVTRAGWPLMTMIGGRLIPTGLSLEPDRMIGAIDLSGPAAPIFGRVLPLRPIWPGFAINTVFYAGILWLLFAAPFALRRRLRRKRGLCPACGYDLRGRPPGSESQACPECGKAANA